LFEHVIAPHLFYTADFLFGLHKTGFHRALRRGGSNPEVTALCKPIIRYGESGYVGKAVACGKSG
jgi:hypothetical protein